MEKGVWDYIPKVQYYNYRGYTTKIIKQDLGHLCGYVVLPKSFNLRIEGCDLDIVYGGITYQRDNVIGFDCAHFMDYIPAIGSGDIRKYKNEVFVKRELKKLVDYLIGMNKS